MGNYSKVDYSKCDYASSDCNELAINLVYGRYRCFDPLTGARTEVLMMYGYNKNTQRAEQVLPMTVEFEGKRMWLLQYNYKSRAQAVMDGELTQGVQMYGQFWSDVTPEMHERGRIR